MSYTAKDVASLRATTGAGMMDCKKALEENGGDIEAAKVGRATVVFVDSLRSFLRSKCKQPRSRA